MKIPTIGTLAFIATLAIPAAHASDIDIFGGIGGASVPNVLFVVDSRASNDATVSPYTCDYAPLSNGKMLQMIQCALYMSINKINSQPALSGKLSMAIMVAGPRWYFPTGAPYNFTLMNPAGVTAITTVLQGSDIKTPGNGSLGEEMWEAWAFFSGHTGPANIAYSSHIGGTLSCQKSFIIMIGNVDDKHSNPSNAPGGNVTDLQNAIPAPTTAQKTKINTSTIGPNTGEDSSSIDEWARYLNQTDFNNNANDRQSVNTYTIGTYGTGLWADKAQEMQSTANQGGGKAFFVNNLTDLTVDLTNIFLEIAAVNTVFASSSLPISSNGQGTYLNQVFIGMFRPDAADNPRWMGNLKQYQFGVGGTTSSPTLFLADATGAAAISGAGTGFLSSTATSFWTSKDTSKLPDSIDPTGATTGTAGGFWINNPQGSDGGFDSRDGEIVEKGGVGQQLRLANLQDDYTQAPGSAQNPRNLYTCTTGCGAGNALSATPFATTNASIDTTALGITGNSSSVSSISRNGTTVTMTLAAAPSPALTAGQAVTVTGAANTEINGTFTIALGSPATTTFTYPITESPPSPSTGTYTASIPSTPVSITGLTRTGTTGSTASATTASAHGFAVNQKVIISGANQSEFNGQVTILTVPTTTTFTYTITPGPPAATSGGTATIGASSITFTTGNISLDSTINNDATFTRLVTVSAAATLPGAFIAGASVTVAGVSPANYDGTFTITTTGKSCPNGSKNVSFCFKVSSTPVLPATGTIVADPSASVGITNFTHTTSCTGATPSPNVTVTATASSTLPATFITGAQITVTGTPGTRESKYLGSNIAITKINSTSFTFTSPITTTPPCSPSASGVSVLTSASSIARDPLINWVRGKDSNGDEPSPDPGVITVRPSIHGDTLHSRPTVVNYGGSTGIVVFYGANDGVYRAINGNQPLNGSTSIGGAGPGGEIWGFIPTEFFPTLKRLYANSPQVALAQIPTTLNPTPTPKDYYFDGSTGVYQDPTTSPQTVSLFMSARRGGRLVYALNVNDPATPKFLWKKTNASTSMGELGYTWSVPKAARVRGYANPVVIFGGGHDPNEDNEPPTADTMGRGIYILDATDGSLVWSATFGAGATGSCTGICTLTDMTYAIPADVTLLNRDFDTGGYIDRLYAADLGGNIWRVDLEPAGYSALASAVGPSTWKITKFASLGGSGTTKRKFFFPPDVVTTKTFDMVLAGTGDREHPLYSASSTQSYAIINRFYGLKDTKIGSDATGATTIADGTSSTANAAVTGMTDATSTPYNPATADNGFYITFPNAGEKAVNAPTTVGGLTYIGTNTPPTPATLACNNLGTARGYQINFLTGSSASVIFDSQGLPPSPVAGLVTVSVGGADRLVPFCLGCGSPGGTGPDATSSIGGIKPPIPVPPVRKRLYWYLDKHDN